MPNYALAPDIVKIANEKFGTVPEQKEKNLFPKKKESGCKESGGQFFKSCPPFVLCCSLISRVVNVNIISPNTESNPQVGEYPDVAPFCNL